MHKQLNKDIRQIVVDDDNNLIVLTKNSFEIWNTYTKTKLAQHISEKGNSDEIIMRFSKLTVNEN